MNCSAVARPLKKVLETMNCESIKEAIYNRALGFLGRFDILANEAQFT